VLRLFARHGGVVLAQRVLFGESMADQQLRVMLTATRVALTQMSALFAEKFFAEANALDRRSPATAPRCMPKSGQWAQCLKRCLRISRCRCDVTSAMQLGMPWTVIQAAFEDDG
jgi:hypothetical protein